MFNETELSFLINAVNEEVKRVGLNAAAMGLNVAAKLQAMDQQMKEEAAEQQPEMQEAAA